MGCLDGIVTPDKTIPSRTGLYANLLPGVTLSLLDDLTKDEQDDYLEFWDDLYTRTKINFVNDVKEKLASKFHIDEKLVSRETSQFDTSINTGSNPGLQIYFYMPKYARIYITSIQVYSNTVVSNAVFTFYDTDQNGQSLGTVTANLTVGINTIYVDQEFEVLEKLFISYNSTTLTLRQTENKYYNNFNYTYFDKLACSYPCFLAGSNSEYAASIFQVNGGGINAIFNIVCSTEKFICQNINLFKNAFFYKIGQELMKERIMSDRFNRWTTLTSERAQELMAVYTDDYSSKLTGSVNNLKSTEDEICFTCKSAVSTSTMLP